MDDETREWLKSGAHIDSFGKVTLDMPLYPKESLLLLRTVALQLAHNEEQSLIVPLNQSRLLEAIALIVQAIRVLEGKGVQVLEAEPAVKLGLEWVEEPQESEWSLRKNGFAIAAVVYDGNAWYWTIESSTHLERGRADSLDKAKAAVLAALDLDSDRENG